MKEACDFSTPRHRPGLPRKNVFWWGENIVTCRTNCIKAMRKWTKSKRRNNLEEIQECRMNYIDEKKILRKAIKMAKKKAWQDLIESVDSEPWKLPYRIVLKRLKRISPGLTETLDKGVLNRLLD